MEFSDYVADLGIDETTITAAQRAKLETSWRGYFRGGEGDKSEAAEAARQAKIDAVRDDRCKAPVVPGNGRAKVSNGTTDALAAALMISHGQSESAVGKLFDNPTMEAATSKELRGIGLHSVCRHVLRAHGKHAPEGRLG